MGKTIVFSWKIDGNKYGYLYVPGSKEPVICDRITDKSVLSSISSEVSNWGSNKYSEKFDTLNTKIRQYTNGGEISGSSDDYYMNDGGNYIILTGGGNNDSENNTVSGDVLDKLKNYIDSKIEVARTSLQEEISTERGAISEEFNTIRRQIDENVSWATAMIDGRYSEQFNALSNVTDYMERASNMFKLSESGVLSADDIIEAISGVTVLRNKVTTAEDRISSIDSLVLNCQSGVDIVQGAYSYVNEKVDQLSENVSAVEAKVERLRQSSYSHEEESEEEIISSSKSQRGIDSENFQYISEIETIDNSDGTFDISARIGDETFKIKVYGYGRKIKATDKEEGLVIANNGFKYFDKSGSFISMVNGNIKLSNSDGSGKLEIKNDGLYINGVKQ